ncbi:MAG: polyhydroxyalkanoate depolymerase [Parvibaculum sp.]|uniref:polyhydroxyalkanoate depolymerase n=1 Tax=Parvibaculum sp. TaxID=2024848 RepID=UPI0025FCD930|nr:polyhydroxyalkanoate depolymerase [Parvibaculum sp.]MCE9649804.1 polyhydroxyalkanoate depolymerase [Parvibaculum sp.]
MLYYAYQLQSDLMKPVRAMADAAATLLNGPMGQFDSPALRNLAAAFEMVSRAGLTHARPPFGIDSVLVGGEEVPVVEEATFSTPFGTLLRFRKATNAVQPRVLVIAPLSGHFATLLRNTVAVLLPEHDVYITDWHNARDVGVEHGRFGFDEYVDHVIRFLEELGPGAHLVSVCQPCAHAFAAVAVMAQTDNPAQPASMTLMAGPIDTRINPTAVNELATTHTIGWFERNLISRVPGGFPGAGRRVYPGFVQLNAFMSMNPKRHIDTHIDLFGHLAKGDIEKAETTKTFYDEYFAVLDLTAEFYLETVNLVFQKHALPKGELTWHGEKVEPAAIRKTALLTVEGERDDICSVGQTLAAQDLCTGIRPYKKRHHLQAGVGHYGVFSGSRWAGQIYPIVRNVILAND